MSNDIDQVIKNNKIINDLIERILATRRATRTPLEINGQMDPLMEILNRELTKCLEIYKLEFPNYECRGKNAITFKQSKGFDCFGGDEGVQITLGMQSAIDEIVMNTMKNLGYTINEDGEVSFEVSFNEKGEAVGNNVESEPNENVKAFKKHVGSTKDHMDYFAYLFAKNGIDMDFVWDVLAHEAMHTFGVVGGNDFLKEGTTEELTREICEKYSVHLSPHSHTQEANFVRKLEMVVGRDKVIKAGMSKESSNEKRYSEVAEEFDSKLGMAKGTFMLYEQMLDNIYKLTQNQKMDKYFYREVFNLPFDVLSAKLSSDKDKKIMEEIQSLAQKIVEKNPGLEFEEPKSDSEVSLISNQEQVGTKKWKIASFNDLMLPIDTAIIEKNLETNNDPKDFKRVIEEQEKEISYLQKELDKIEPGKNTKGTQNPITEQEIGKDTVLMPTEEKDSSKRRVNEDQKEFLETKDKQENEDSR